MSDTAHYDLKHVVIPGDVIGDRFHIEAHIHDDPDWPIRAVESGDKRRRVQLAIGVLGAWIQNNNADGEWVETYPHLRHRHALPQISCERVRHGGGLLSVSVSPDLTAALPDLLVTSDPESRLRALRHVHTAAEPIELMHGRGDAHGEISLLSFRLDDEKTCRLRLPVAKSSGDPKDRSMEHDLRALRRVIFAITDVRGRLPEPEEPRRYRPVFPGQHLKAYLRAVLKTRRPTRKAGYDITKWRRSLDRLIREIEVSLLSDDSRQTRLGMVRSLLEGDLARALALTGTSDDAWCQYFQEQLERRREEHHAAFTDWLHRQQHLLLHESAERLARLAAQGFPLPDHDAVRDLRRRLNSNILHLREAARCVHCASWPAAHKALNAATTLDAGNPVLAAIATLAGCLARSEQECTS